MQRHQSALSRVQPVRDKASKARSIKSLEYFDRNAQGCRYPVRVGDLGLLVSPDRIDVMRCIVAFANPEGDLYRVIREDGNCPYRKGLEDPQRNWLNAFLRPKREMPIEQQTPLLSKTMLYPSHQN